MERRGLGWTASFHFYFFFNPDDYCHKTSLNSQTMKVNREETHIKRGAGGVGGMLKDEMIKVENETSLACPTFSFFFSFFKPLKSVHTGEWIEKD